MTKSRANTKAKATLATPSPSMTDAPKQSNLPGERDSTILKAIRGIQTDIKALKTELLTTIDAKINEVADKFREEFAKHREETTSDIRHHERTGSCRFPQLCRSHCPGTER